MYFSHLGVFLISVKPLATEITENKTAPKICKITVAFLHRSCLLCEHRQPRSVKVSFFGVWHYCRSFFFFLCQSDRSKSPLVHVYIGLPVMTPIGLAACTNSLARPFWFLAMTAPVCDGTPEPFINKKNTIICRQANEANGVETHTNAKFRGLCISSRKVHLHCARL